MTSREQSIPAVSFDEIGIATARHGGLVLKSAFQIIFTPRDGQLRATAAASFLRPFMKGAPVSPLAFFAALDADEWSAVERLATSLHIANHGQIGAEGLAHVLGPGAALAAWPGDACGRKQRLICSLRVPAGAGETLASAFATRSAELALGGLAGEPPPLEAIRRLAPAIVRIDGAWFRQIAHHDGAVRLLARLVEEFKAQGARVLVEGIETRGELEAALSIEADLLQGYLLARPQLAGTVVERTVLPLREILPVAAEVIPLFGGGR